MVMTTKGELPEEILEKRLATFKSADCLTTATEYWLNNELVHRSVNVELIGRDLSGVQQPIGA